MAGDHGRRYANRYPAENRSDDLAGDHRNRLQSTRCSVSATRVEGVRMEVRWDSEWSDRLFTSVEYQHQAIDDVTNLQPTPRLPWLEGISADACRSA